MPSYDLDGVPRASGVTFGRCRDPHCRRLHIIMLDSNDRPAISGAMSIDSARMMIEDLKGHVYALIATGD